MAVYRGVNRSITMRLKNEIFIKIKDEYLKGYSLNFLCEREGVPLSTVEKRKKKDEKENGKWIKGSERLTYYELINKKTELDQMDKYIHNIREEAELEVIHLENIKKIKMKSENKEMQSDNQNVTLNKAFEEAFALKINNMKALREFKKIVMGILPSPAEFKLLESKHKENLENKKFALEVEKANFNMEQLSIGENNEDSKMSKALERLKKIVEEEINYDKRFK